MLTLTPDITWLALTLLLSGSLWIPYILQLAVQLGPLGAAWDPTGAHPHDADWALRSKRAHYNAVENLVVFAPLVLLVVGLGLANEKTATAAAIYFWARLGHNIVYTLAVPLIRTALFLVGYGCQVALAGRVLGWW